ncbi:hypothetical protein [Rhodoferax ferrireducens]|uniref:hypothetical protein n=1 Tax=Rhodoferax ferrireducens TaxID=192843 RepID=UPI0013002E13|nr:hypothetical protein [Rhodoferax ferrireducens]
MELSSIIEIAHMETRDLPRHKIIVGLTAQLTEKVADTAIALWEQMATQIIAIVGEGGFNSLYARSLFLTASHHPWLASGALSPQTGQRFAELKICMEEQAPAQVVAGTSLLLITFTDILASLIGEQLTVRILQSAWGHGTQGLNGKEFNSE